MSGDRLMMAVRVAAHAEVGLAYGHFMSRPDTKLVFLQEPHTEFIFSVEPSWLPAVVLVGVGLAFLLAWRFTTRSRRRRQDEGRMRRTTPK